MKLSTLEKENYQGNDASLEISLFEYGLASQEKKDYHNVIFGVNIDDSGNYIGFDAYNEMRDSDLPINEDWFNLPAVLSFVGMNKKEWLKLSFLQRLSDCLSYYGCQNIMGDSYNTFQIES